MSANDLKRRFTPMDAFFLYLEREEEPMTVGCVAEFEGRVPFKKFLRSVDARLHLIPRYRQRVVHAPFNIGLPTWEDDPNFDIENHVIEVKLKKPATSIDLKELGEEIFSGMMHMDRPLWEIYLVRGLSGDRTGLIVRVHHCMVDGVAGVGLLQIIFDATPETPRIKKKPFKPDPIPDGASLLYDALWDNAIDGVEYWTKFQKSLVDFGRGRSFRQVAEQFKDFGATMATFLSPLKRMSFNKAFSGGRKFAFSECSFSEARAIRAACGGTVNDVGLAVLGGAVAKYLQHHGESIKGVDLRVLVPVNIRNEDERGAMGNRISFLPVQVPLHVKSPVERLKRITEHTKSLKKSHVADSIALMFNALQGSPALVQKLSLNGVAKPSVQSALGLMAQMPPMNLICTNVPGPQIPLYAVGHQMMHYYSLLPITLEMGISCAISSYNQRLYFTLMADENCAPDIEVMMEFHQESFVELREAAAVQVGEYIELYKRLETPGEADNGRSARIEEENATKEGAVEVKQAPVLSQAAPQSNN